MSMNIGRLDRGLRLVVAALLYALAFAPQIALTGLAYWLALLVGAILVLTALVGVCPLYSILGLKTCRKC